MFLNQFYFSKGLMFIDMYHYFSDSKICFCKTNETRKKWKKIIIYLYSFPLLVSLFLSLSYLLFPTLYKLPSSCKRDRERERERVREKEIEREKRDREREKDIDRKLDR